MKAIPKQITVEIDTREQYPLLFPKYISVEHPEDHHKHLRVRVNTERIKLTIGDYRLKECPSACVVEKKSGQLELFKNLFDLKDQVRQAKAFRRLSAVEHPYLLIEGSPSDLLRTRLTPVRITRPERILDRLSTVISKYHFNVLWMSKPHTVSTRRALGTAVLHLMFSYGFKNLTTVVLGRG